MVWYLGSQVSFVPSFLKTSVSTWESITVEWTSVPRSSDIASIARFADSLHVDMWIRRVVVQSLTDDPSELFALGEFIGGLKSLKALDAIPYHTLGAHKYKELGLDYALEGVPNTTKDKAREARAHILEGIKKARNKKMTEN